MATAVFLWIPKAEEHYPYGNGFYVSISADGNYILARRHSYPGSVYLFARENNVPVWSHYYNGWIDLASMSADASYIVVDDRHSAARLFHKTNNIPQWTLEPGGFNGLQISLDGARVLVPSTSSFRLFRWLDNTILWSYAPDLDTVSASLLNDNYIVVVKVNALYLFNQTDNTPIWSYQASYGNVGISPDGSYITEHDEITLYLFNRADNALLWSYEFSDWTNVAVFSADGNYIVVEEGDLYSRTIFPEGGPGGFYLFSKSENTPILSYNADGWVGRKLFSITSDGSYIAVAHQRKLHLFSQSSNTPLWSWDPPKGTYISSVSISANGNYIAVGAEGPYPSVEGSVYVFSKDSNVPLWFYHEAEPYS